MICCPLSLFEINSIYQKRHRSSDSTASGRDRSYSTDSAEMLPSRLKEEPWLLEISSSFLQQYVQYLQSMGFILVQVRPQSPARRSVSSGHDLNVSETILHCEVEYNSWQNTVAHFLEMWNICIVYFFNTWNNFTDLLDGATKVLGLQFEVDKVSGQFSQNKLVWFTSRLFSAYFPTKLGNI